MSHADTVAGVVCPDCGGRLSWQRHGDSWDGWCKECRSVTVQRPFEKTASIDRTREVELAREPTALADRFSTPIVGVTFVPGYPGNVRAAEAALMMSEAYGDEKPSAVLIRRPENPYDENAVEVHVPAIGSETAMIGHLPRALARRLAPELDAHQPWLAWVRSVRTHSAHEDRPGIDVELMRVTEPGASPT